MGCVFAQFRAAARLNGTRRARTPARRASAPPARHSGGGKIGPVRPAARRVRAGQGGGSSHASLTHSVVSVSWCRPTNHGVTPQRFIVFEESSWGVEGKRNSTIEKKKIQN